MPLFYHWPLHPQSRFIRLVMGELQMDAEFIEEILHERRREFLAINPAATLPVLVEQDGQVVPGAGIVAEYLDETRGLVLQDRRLLPENPAARVEVRRLMSWFNIKFSEEVSQPLLIEKIEKRLFSQAFAGVAPDPRAIRAAHANIRYHLAYIGHMVSRRNWLAGESLTYADLAAAAQLSVVDYLGDVPWETNEAARTWFARVKSRPSFRPLLLDRLRGIPPADHYTNLDF